MAGLSIAWIAETIAPRSRQPTVQRRKSHVPRAFGSGFALTCTLVAASPDLDVLITTHRTYSHTLGAAFMAGIIATIVAALLRLPVGRTGMVCAAAYASHILLDRLGKDSSSPYGMMALWPISSAYYSSGADIFFEISRRYWNPDEFIIGNAKSVAWEVRVLAPDAIVAWWIQKRATTPK